MSTAKTIRNRQEVYGIIIGINQIVVWVVKIKSTSYSIKDSKSFIYKVSITRKLEGINTQKEKVKIVVLLKHLSNFWRTVDIPLTNCKINLILTSS